MTEGRKHVILLSTVILTARKLQPLLEEDDAEGKPKHGQRILGRDPHREVDGARGAHS